MAELSFWDRCWQGAEPERLDALASRLDLSEDPVARCLRERGAKTVC